MNFCGPSIQKEISKQKQKFSYLFVQIKWEEALLRDYVNVIKSLSSRVSPQKRPAQRFLNFHVLKKSRVFQRFSKLLLLCVSRQIFGVLSMSLFYYFSQYTWKININGQKSGDAEAAKPALAFENVDFVDDVVIFVIVRINETRKVLYVKVRPRYYINK